MGHSKLTAFVAVLALVAGTWLIARSFSKPKRATPSTTARAPEEQREAPLRKADSRQPSSSNAPTATPVSKRGGEAAQELAALLERHSRGERWEVDIGQDGLPVRMTGQGLEGVLGDEQSARPFLEEYTKLLGFETLPPLRRESSSSTSFLLVDFHQSHATPTGEEIPVYESWIRFKGVPEKGAFIANNHLRPVSTRIRMDVTLSDADALAIVRREFPDSKSRLEIHGSTVVYAHSEPHQKATQVVVSGPLPHWHVLVGHETRSIVHKSMASRE